MTGLVMRIHTQDPMKTSIATELGTTAATIRPVDKLAPASHRFGSLEAFDAATLSDERFSVTQDQGLFECKLHLNPAAPRLFVILTSSHALSNELPDFQKIERPQSFPGSILYVSDPTLFFDRELTLGWYIGTAKYDWTSTLSRLVQSVARKLEIPLENVLTFGSSGAGLAAIQVACALGPATAIAINPHMDVRKYHAANAEKFLIRCFGTTPALATSAEHDRRLSAISSMQGSAETRIIYVQNKNNEHVYKQHFMIFCQAFGLDPASPTIDDDTMNVITYSGKASSASVPAAMLEDIIVRAIALNDAEQLEHHEALHVDTLEEAGSPGQIEFIKKQPLPKEYLQEPVKRFSSLEDFAKGRLNKGRFIVGLPSGKRFECLFTRKPSANKLFVMLSGARNWKIPEPEFSRLSWHAALPGSMLCVADPGVLRPGKKLALAWYVGTNQHNWTDALAELVRLTCDKLNITTSDVIAYGSSGGGFGALMLAAALEDATAVAINPQTQVLQYHARPVNNFLKAAFDVAAAPELDENLVQSRLSAINAIRHAPRAKVLFVQNKNDRHHYEKHCKPFCEALDIPLTGKNITAGRIQTLLYVDRPGHRGEPEKIVPEILRRALAMTAL